MMLNIGIIGTGFVGKIHASVLRDLDGVQLIAISDFNEDAGREAAEKNNCTYYQDAEALMQDDSIDIVDICLPTFLHEKYVLLAASYKKHVICEKPFTLSISAAENMISATEDAGVYFMIAQVIRFWPEYVKARQLFKDEIFGRVKMVYANRLAQHPNWSTWHRDVKKSGGGLFDLHIHDIDYMCYLFGNVERVYACGDKDSNNCWNHVMTSLTFKNGNSATVEGAFEMTDNYPFTMFMRITGEKASYEYNFQAGFNLEDEEEVQRSAVLFRNGEEPEKLEIDEFDAYRRELEYFTGCIRDKRPLIEAAPKHSLYVLKVVKAIETSLETGEVVRFN